MAEATDTQFEALYREHAREVHAYCLRRTSSEDAKDATAEVFLTAWRRLTDIPAGQETLPWLYGVARRTLANRARSQRRRDRLYAKASGVLRGTAEGPEPQVIQNETFREVNKALRRLNERDREILRLIEWEGMSRQQVADMFFVSRAAIDKRVARAYRKMEKQLRTTDSGVTTTPVTLEEGGEV